MFDKSDYGLRSLWEDVRYERIKRGETRDPGIPNDRKEVQELFDRQGRVDFF